MSSSVLIARAVREVETKPVPARSKPRLDSIDLLRGVAIVFMILDHVRDYFSAAQFSPADLNRTTPALFFTRWVTHFCAPVFVSLAGTSVYLSARGGKTRPELARYLLTRGLWLILLELTVLRFGMCFSLDYRWVSFTILWAIGWSMIALAGLIALPTPVVGAIGLAIVCGHNLLDGVAFDHPNWLRVFWTALHGLRQTPFTRRRGLHAVIMYPVLPWIGVMACGYAFGAVLEMERRRRRRVMLDLGFSMLIGFLALRALNVYGDPDPWQHRSTLLATVLSLLNVTKYPPSLQFLLITLGPSLIALACLDRERDPDRKPGRLESWLLTFGRVPMFVFLVHWQVIHGLAVLVAFFRGQPVGWMFQEPPFETPDNYGYRLPIVYLIWAVVVIGLFPACRWFADLKKRRRDLWWLSYF